MICENCKQKHNGSYGSGRFCSSKCARGFSTKEKREEINAKVGQKLKIIREPRLCYCGKEFVPKNKNQKCCSVECSARQNIKLASLKLKIQPPNWSKINKKSYQNGNNVVAGGTTKWYEYNGIKVQGTYELRTCKILDFWKEKNLIKDWEYTKDRFQYQGTDAKQHSYLLDFKVINHDDTFYYIEVKGYEKENDKLKWNAVKSLGYKLEVWFENTIRYYEQFGVLV